MSTRVVFYSVVKRHMKRNATFVVAEGHEPPPGFMPNLGETVIGYYRNPPPWEDERVVFTSEAIYTLARSCSRRIPLEDITGYEMPPKDNPTGVRIRTRDGFAFVRVAGTFGPNGNQKDAFSFLQVIRALLPRAASPRT